jgi:hypothetical protein
MKEKPTPDISGNGLSISEVSRKKCSNVNWMKPG